MVFNGVVWEFELPPKKPKSHQLFEEILTSLSLFSTNNEQNFGLM